MLSIEYLNKIINDHKRKKLKEWRGERKKGGPGLQIKEGKERKDKYKDMATREYSVVERKEKE